jgi:hypothetical protein
MYGTPPLWDSGADAATDADADADADAGSVLPGYGQPVPDAGG